MQVCFGRFGTVASVDFRFEPLVSAGGYVRWEEGPMGGVEDVAEVREGV
jgi:hypothetical protein